jgi:hypothetical protein
VGASDSDWHKRLQTYRRGLYSAEEIQSNAVFSMLPASEIGHLSALVVRRGNRPMDMQGKALNRYSVEISGWNVDENFFVENTELNWTLEQKTIQLQHPIRQGTVVFVRLIGINTQENSVPVAYQAAEVTYRMQQRCYDVFLTQMLPRMHSEFPAVTLLK